MSAAVKQRHCAAWELLLMILLLVVPSSGVPRCLFGPQYSVSELLCNSSAVESFLEDVFTWEGHFHRPGISFNQMSGLTYDGHSLNYTTGGPGLYLHEFSAASKESLQLDLMAKALTGNKLATLYFGSIDTVLQILHRKITSYWAFNQKYPGFGGFLPWFAVTDTGIALLNGWYDTVPGLDNGQLAWGMYAISRALEEHKDGKQLAVQYRKYFELMVANGITVFYAGHGLIRSVAKIHNTSAEPTVDNYSTQGSGFLDDPYEGELFTFLLDLFGKWHNDTEREEMWIAKRALLQRVEYQSSLGSISVQRGWWFSSHEQWKALVLPYYEVPICSKVLKNCERARTLHSSENSIPGMYASVNDVAQRPSQIIPTYISATGIESIAFQNILRTDVVTPYAAFPTILANRTAGLAWYLNMLQGPRMQGPLGSTEAVSVDGRSISPLVTWDSKVTTVLAMVGGISDLTEKYMKQDGVWERFYFVANREYSRVFTSLEGETLPFGLPTAHIPVENLGHFDDCSS